MYTCEKCHKPCTSLYALKETANEVKQWGCLECWERLLKTKEKKAVGKRNWNYLEEVVE